jgi:RimJ/RimL family protein N-acetyltransferase
MRDVVQNNFWAKEIVEERCGWQIKGEYSGLVFMEGSNVIGAAVFNHYNGWSAEFACTLLEGKVGMKIARRVAHYVFVVMGCHRCTAITAWDNIKAQVALAKIGFRMEGVMREHFPGRKDGYVYGLLRHEQKLLRI